MDTRIAITVVMRSYNDARLLPRTLQALREQTGVRIRLVVIESASTDGSPEILKAARPDRYIELAPGTYRSSRVLNRGVRAADGELVAFVNSDAILGRPDVLLELAKSILANPNRAGAFAAQTTRPDANVMTRLDHEIAFGDRAGNLGEGAQWMSLVCAMIRRSVWMQVPFDERLTFAEDAVWSQRVIEAGYDIVYRHDLPVEHSHDYTWSQRYRRAYGDAAALAVLATAPPARTILGGVVKPFIKRVLRDSIRLASMGQLLAAWRLPAYRWPQLLGAWHGKRDAYARLQDQADAEQPVAHQRAA